MNQQHERSKAGQKLADTSMTKAVVYFKDGNARTFHSRDFARNAALPDMNLGFARLRKMIESWGSKVSTAIIYDKSSDSELDRFVDGAWN